MFQGLSASTLAIFLKWASIISVIGATITALSGTVLYFAAGERDRRADIRMSETERIIAKAQVDVATASQAAAEARRGLGFAESEIATANARAERDRLERVKLEQKIQARSVSDKASDEIVRELREYAILRSSAEKQLVHIFSTTNDLESVSFAQQISATLQDAGWRTDGVSATYGQSYAVKGIAIMYLDNARSKTVARAVAGALERQGWGVETRPFNKEYRAGEIQPSTALSIMVGSRF